MKNNKWGSVRISILGKEIKCIAPLKYETSNNTDSEETVELVLTITKSEYNKIIKELEKPKGNYETPDSFLRQTEQEILSDLKNGTSFGMK